MAVLVLVAALAAPPPPDQGPPPSCTPRRTCDQISTCAQARWYLRQCKWGQKLDRDHDGAPCERLCGNA